jgi:signal peptidase I
MKKRRTKPAGKPSPDRPRAPARAEKTGAGGKSSGHGLRYHLDWVISTIILALFGTTFSLQAFEIPSASMEDTLLIGERVLVDRSAFARPGRLSRAWMPQRQVRRGDIIVFKFPLDPSIAYVKRVAGLPGDRLRLVRGQLQVNGRFVAEPYVVHKDPALAAYRDNFPAAAPPADIMDAQWRDELPGHLDRGWLVVPPGRYFVMGDNRDYSLDSRYWGFVPAENILGSPLLIFWSLNSTSEDFRAASPWEQAMKFARRIVLFPFRARWERMFLPAG